MNGRFHQETFKSGLALRVRSQPTARQCFPAGPIHAPVEVERRGRVQVDTRTCGRPEIRRKPAALSQERAAGPSGRARTARNSAAQRRYVSR